MAKSKRSAEEVCIEYAVATRIVRELSAKVRPGECTSMASAEFRPGWPGPSTPIEPCISRLFSLKPTPGEDYDYYLEEAEEIESEMCERCVESLKAVRERKEARKRLGAAKRAVEAIGKREAARG
jgi:hypothetical protein